MTKKKKALLRKIIYFILFSAMIFCFIYIGNKYTDNTKDKIVTISDYYKEIDNKKYEVVRGKKLISLLKEGKHLILIGNQKSEFSQKYIQELTSIIENLNIDKVYYYDIINDKAQANSNYYEIIELLDGHLVTTDSSNKNLFAPSFYIVVDGKVKYYNIETVAMKNTDTIESYWNIQTEFNFRQEVSSAIDKFYF
jgi:hypothetical protein